MVNIDKESLLHILNELLNRSRVYSSIDKKTQSAPERLPKAVVQWPHETLRTCFCIRVAYFNSPINVLTCQQEISRQPLLCFCKAYGLKNNASKVGQYYSICNNYYSICNNFYTKKAFAILPKLPIRTHFVAIITKTCV